MISSNLCEATGVDLTSSIFLGAFLLFVTADLIVNSRALAAALK